MNMAEWNGMDLLWFLKMSAGVMNASDKTHAAFEFCCTVTTIETMLRYRVV